MKTTTIQLTTQLTGTEAKMVAFSFDGWTREGANVAIKLPLLECWFQLQTFFYGHNLKTFLTDSERLCSGLNSMAVLTNYDETITLEFVRLNPENEFLSVKYRSVIPESCSAEQLSLLQRESKLAQEIRSGSHFSCQFLKLQTPIGEFVQALNQIVASTNVSLENPYPH